MTGSARRVQNKACLTCKRRKVRCDLGNLQTGPCTACRKFGSICIPKPSRRRPVSPPSTLVAGIVPAASNSPIPTLSPSTGSSSVQNTSSLQLNTNAESLSSFVQRGIATNDWSIFAGCEPERIVYVGTDVSNFSHLVRSEQSDRCTNHYPFPQIHDVLPWKPTLEQTNAAGISKTTHDELSSFPTKSIRDELVDAFFDLVNPGYPVINEHEFRRQYNDPDHPPPLLLFQAVLLVGAHVSNHPMVSASRGMVLTTLYRRAKILFDLRHENDRMHLVQAALLLAWHTDNPDFVSANHYHWIGVACRIAFGLGMHRDLNVDVDCLMPPKDRRMYRRIWWTLLQAECFSALEYGRPCMIRQEDFDQAILTDADFIESEQIDMSRTDRKFCQINTQLALVALEVLESRAPRARIENPALTIELLSRKLAAVGLNIPPNHDVWTCQLRINYNLILLLLHRRVPGRIPPRIMADEVSLICSEAAADILSTFEAMASQQTIRQCQLSSIDALMAVTIQFAQECKSALERLSTVRAIGTHSQLQRLLGPAKQLSEYWPHAEPITRLCQYFYDKYEIVLKSSMDPPSGLPTQQSGQDFDRNWQNIFADFDAQQFDQYLSQQPSDWMTSSASIF